MLEMNMLHLIDCMEGMKEIPDKFFDLAIVDPAQKPVALYKWILSRYAKEGDKILDTHV